MVMAPTLNELLQLAKSIADVDLSEKLVEVGGTRTMRRRQYQMIAARFESRRAAYVDSILASCQDRTDVVGNISLQLDQLARVSDSSLSSAIEYVRSNLLPYLQRQALIPPPIRAIIKALNKAFFVFAVVFVFGTIGWTFYAILTRLYEDLFRS
jgi:hypothetical protein